MSHNGIFCQIPMEDLSDFLKLRQLLDAILLSNTVLVVGH